MSFVNGKYTGAKALTLVHQGGASTPRSIVMHYTVTDTVTAAKNALNAANNGNGLSYTFLIDHDGTVWQTRAPDRSSAHAGRSNWKAASGVGNTSSLNTAAVSISFINRGFFGHRNGDFYFDLNAHGNLINKSYPASEVHTTASIYDPGTRRHWHRYTEAQLTAARRLIEALVQAYPTITELIGHDDIAIDGKQDTGPLFPMAEWRKALGLEGPPGLQTQVSTPGDTLSLRRRPSASAAELAKLPHGATLWLRSVVYTYKAAQAIVVDGPKQRYLTRWASVDVDGSNRHAGYVHMRHLTRTPLLPNLAAKL